MRTKEEIEAKIKELETYMTEVTPFSEVKAEIYILKWVLETGTGTGTLINR